MTTPDPAGTPYGLHRPTMTDARDAMHRVHGPEGPAAWSRLLHGAGLAGNEPGEDALLRLVDAMASFDSVSRLCAQALRIRLSTFTHLAAAHTMTRSPA